MNTKKILLSLLAGVVGATAMGVSAMAASCNAFDMREAAKK